jgi:hypothetical protein
VLFWSSKWQFVCHNISRPGKLKDYGRNNDNIGFGDGCDICLRLYYQQAIIEFRSFETPANWMVNNSSSACSFQY